MMRSVDPRRRRSVSPDRRFCSGSASQMVISDAEAAQPLMTSSRTMSRSDSASTRSGDSTTISTVGPAVPLGFDKYRVTRPAQPALPRHHSRSLNSTSSRPLVCQGARTPRCASVNAMRRKLAAQVPDRNGDRLGPRGLAASGGSTPGTEPDEKLCQRLRCNESRDVRRRELARPVLNHHNDVRGITVPFRSGLRRSEAMEARTPKRVDRPRGDVRCVCSFISADEPHVGHTRIMFGCHTPSRGSGEVGCQIGEETTRSHPCDVF